MEDPSAAASDAELQSAHLPRAGDSPLQRPACTRCRQHKLKCSKEKPTCRRCANAAKPCTYPAPLDRRRLVAQRRGHVSLDSRVQAPELKVMGEYPVAAAGFSISTSPVNPSSPRSRIGEDPNEKIHATQLPSREIAMFLIEVYFSRAYNASLLFHKPRFLSDWILGKVKPFVALSIFATASIFLENDQNRSGKTPPGATTHNWRKSGAEWATRASHEALAQADLPSIETVQACQTLALYWFASGITDRVHIHAHVAYRTCRLLGIGQIGQVEEDATAAELRRRCLWACWITQCISQGNAIFKTRCWDDIAGVPLPSDEDSYLNGDPHSTQFLTIAGDVQQLQGADQQAVTSLMSELAKLAGIWWEAHDLIKRVSAYNNLERKQSLGTWVDLVTRLENIEAAAPQFYGNRKLSIPGREFSLEHMFSVLCLRHTCNCILNVAIVPLSSPPVAVMQLPKSFTLTAAQLLVDHACSVLQLANELYNHQPDPSKIPSLTGYCLYFCILVQMRHQSAQPNSRRSSSSPGGALSILTALAEYWNPLGTFAGKFCRPSQPTSVGFPDCRPVHVSEYASADVLPEVEDYVPDENLLARGQRMAESASKVAESVHQAPPERHGGNSTRHFNLNDGRTTRMEEVSTEQRTAFDERDYATLQPESGQTEQPLIAWWELDTDTISPDLFSIFDDERMDTMI